MKTFLTLILLLLITAAHAQTVVKLTRPEQAEDPVSAHTLFDESLPAGIPIAIGMIGYDITGGTSPYTFQWLEGDALISEGEVAIITPVAGKDYFIKVLDKHSCSIVLPISIGQSQAKKSEGGSPSLFKYLTREFLFIQPSMHIEGGIRLKIFDTRGMLLLDERAYGENYLPVNLLPGTYLVYSHFNEIHAVEKIIVP